MYRSSVFPLMAALAAVAVLPASTASAQETPTRIQRPPPAVPGNTSLRGEAEAQRVMRAYAVCVLLRYRSRVEAFLATPPASEEALRVGTRIATGECLHDGELRFKELLFRGGLYEALYERDFRRAPARDVSAAPPIDYAAGGAAADQVALRLFADCTARANPDAARSLILSAVGSGAENAAFAALGEALGGCLVAGERVAFSRPVLRGVIAEALYRLSQAAGQ